MGPLSVRPSCNVGVLWPRPRLHFVRWRPSSPQKGHGSPTIFGSCLLWQNGWVVQDATWYRSRPRPGRIVLDGDPASPAWKKGTSAPFHFSAHVYCGQTAEWIKMALGKEVCLGPGDIVLDGDPAPSTLKWAQQLPHCSAHFALTGRPYQQRLSSCQNFDNAENTVEDVFHQ